MDASAFKRPPRKRAGITICCQTPPKRPCRTSCRSEGIDYPALQQVAGGRNTVTTRPSLKRPRCLHRTKYGIKLITRAILYAVSCCGRIETNAAVIGPWWS